MAGKSTSMLFAIFKNSSFKYLWIGQLVSSMGNALTALASSILVYRVTGTALSVGLMLIATSGPTIVIGLLAGVFVDRYDRKRIMLTCDLLRAILVSLIPILIPFNIHWIYVIVAAISAVTQFFDSAHASILPEITSDRELSAANALMTISSVGSMTIGFAAAGLIASGVDILWAFRLNGISFLVSAMLVFYTHIPTLPEVENTSLRAVGQNLRTGLMAVGAMPSLRSLFLIHVPIFFLFGLQSSLVLPFALGALHGTEFDFGLLQAAETIGIAAGSLLVARLLDRLRLGQWIALSYITMGIAILFFSNSRMVAPAILFMGLAGILNAPSFVGRQILIQRSVARDLRGRVMSAFFVVRDLMLVAGMGLAWLADVFDVRILLGVSSLALVLAGGAVLVLPGLGPNMTEWKRALTLLKGAEAAPRLGAGRPTSLEEVTRFVRQMPGLDGMNLRDLERLASETLVAGAPGGMIVTFRGEMSDMAYFILKGSVAAGAIQDEEYVIANVLHEGELFGEIAALMGTVRSANVITEEECEFLVIPAGVLQRLEREYPGLRPAFYTTIVERLNRIELPRSTGLDQGLLRELRTTQPETEAEPAAT